MRPTVLVTCHKQKTFKYTLSFKDIKILFHRSHNTLSLLSGIHHLACAVNYSKHTILSNVFTLAQCVQMIKYCSSQSSSHINKLHSSLTGR